MKKINIFFLNGGYQAMITEHSRELWQSSNMQTCSTDATSPLIFFFLKKEHLLRFKLRRLSFLCNDVSKNCPNMKLWRTNGVGSKLSLCKETFFGIYKQY